MFPKDKRLRMPIEPPPPCWICGDPDSEWDHLRSFGAGGGSELSNLQPLCRKEHQLRHLIGLREFVKRFNLPISWDTGFPKRTDI